MSDTHAACMNFVNALEKLPDTIRQHRERAEKKRGDVPTLEAIVSRTWGKENELKALKSQLAALDRKITAELAPTHEVPDDRMGVNNEEQDSVENKPTSTVEVNTTKVDAPSTSGDQKKTMVAEPLHQYIKSTGLRTFHAI